MQFGKLWEAGNTQLSSPVSEVKLDPADIPGVTKYETLKRITSDQTRPDQTYPEELFTSQLPIAV